MTQLWTSTDLRLRWAVVVVLVAVILPAAWYVGSPFFIDNMINESFPDLSQPATTDLSGNPIEARVDTTAAQGDSTAAERVEGRTEPADATAAETLDLVSLTSGTFTDVDAIHKGEGRATVYQLGDGQRVLRLEDFRVTNGPSLYMYLSGHSAPRSSEQLHVDGALEIGRLKGNIGNQNYELPVDLDLSQYKSVVTYCKPFRVIFSTAELGGEA